MMSVFLTGILYFRRELPFEEIIRFAERISLDNSGSFYVKFGGNVALPRIQMPPATLAYEITNSIIENTAEEIAAPKEYLYLAPWEQRREKLNQFVCSVFSCEEITEMTMDIDAESGDCSEDDFIVCRQSEFRRELDGAYSTPHALIEPHIRIDILR